MDTTAQLMHPYVKDWVQSHSLAQAHMHKLFHHARTHHPKLTYEVFRKHTRLMTISQMGHLPHPAQAPSMVFALRVIETSTENGREVHRSGHKCTHGLLWELHKLHAHDRSDVPFQMTSSGPQSLAWTSWRQSKIHKRYVES